ncbi:MAG: SPFH domain-containing protein [Fimbriimonadaceae bacterium]
MIPILIISAVVVVAFLVFLASLKGLVFNCAPNEVLIKTGPSQRVGGKSFAYKVFRGGYTIRIPLLERIDRLDLTNMVIDVQAVNAYSKGGIPLTVQGVANVKIASHEPLLNHAVERFLGKTRQEIMQIAKATLEGSLRGILASMTPEQVNEDKLLFAERLVAEVEQDMTALGLVVDTMKIQSVTDEVRYLDSIGRKKNAEVVSKARIAEAIARADSKVRAAENLGQEVLAQTQAAIETAKADAEKRLAEIRTRRDALIAEELAAVNALVAKARAEVDVQKARVEQVRRQLEADVIQPAKAEAEAAEQQAVAAVAQIIQDGRARAEALRKVADSIREAGPSGKQLLLLQKLERIVEKMTEVIPETDVEKVTMIGTGTPGYGQNGDFAVKTLSTLEQLKQVLGVDILEKLGLKDGEQAAAKPRPTSAAASPPPSEPRRGPETGAPALPANPVSAPRQVDVKESRVPIDRPLKATAKPKPKSPPRVAPPPVIFDVPDTGDEGRR